VKAIQVAALLAVVGSSVAGCGSSKGAVSGPITVTGTTTVSNVKAGTLIRCRGGPAVKAPHWFGSGALTVPGVPGEIHLTHRYNGWITVSCRP
jgi:hypothetical protein